MKSIKQVVVLALSFLFFLGTLALENVFAGQASVLQKGQLFVEVSAGQTVEVTHQESVVTLSSDTSRPLQTGDIVAVKSGTGVVRFSHDGVVRLSENAILKVNLLDASKDSYVLSLSQGRAWVNSLYTTAEFNLLAGSAYLIPDSAAFDVNVHDQKTEVFANRHHVSIGLVPENFEPKQAKLFPDADFINSYLLPQGNQTAIFADKIAQNQETLRKLYYSKLVKEFPFGMIDPQVLNDDVWIKQNMLADTSYASKIADDTAGAVRSRGLKVVDVDAFGYSFSQALGRFYSVLTVSGQKVITRLADDIFTHFDDAEYYLVFGQNSKAKDRLNLFIRLLDQSVSSQGDDYKSLIFDRLQQKYDRLVSVTPDDALAPAKTVVNSYLFKLSSNDDDGIRQNFMLVRRMMNSVYDLAGVNSAATGKSFEDYFIQLRQLVDQSKSRASLVANILAEENQIMNNLFFQYSVFYRDNIFAMKSELEQDWLNNLPVGEHRNEEKQTVVSTKIDFLRQLKTFFLAEKIDVDDAKKIDFRLFGEAYDLQLSPTDKVAVNDLYNQRLADAFIFYLYLNSPEYVSTKLHGVSHKNQFDEFVKNQSLVIKKIMDKAAQDFADIGVRDVTFGTLESVDQPLVSVQNASFAGVRFTAQYDWDKKLLSQISVGGKLLTKDTVNLKNVSQVIKQNMQTPGQQNGIDMPPTQGTQPVDAPQPLSKSELAAKILLVQKLKANGMAVMQKDVVIVDLAQGFFTVQKAILVSDQAIALTFDVDSKNEVITGLKVTTTNGLKSVSGSVNLGDLLSVVNAQ